MRHRISSISRSLSRKLFASGLLIALAACGKQAGTDPVDASVTAPTADAATVAEAAENSTITDTVANPLCDKATFAEVSAAEGGNFDKVDVIDVADLHYVDCVFLDSKDLYAGLTIRFVSDAKLVATSSNWPTAAAYFDEWSRGGANVEGVGERAAWTELPAGLLVLAGDHALQVSASKSDLNDAAVRARFETLARAVVARMP